MPLTSDSFISQGNTPGIFPQGPTGNPVMGDPVAATRIASVQAVAVANTDTQIPLPLGARILNVVVSQNVAPTGTTATLAVGTTQGGVDICPATDVKTNAFTTVPLALNAMRPLLVANFASVVASSAGGSVVWARLAQTGATAVGTFTVLIRYSML